MANKYVCVDVYTVQAGDTLYSIAQRYNVDVGLLMRVNQVRNPYNLRIGTRLCIPGPAQDNDGGTAPDAGGNTQPGTNPAQPPAPAPLPEVMPESPDSAPDRRCRTVHTVQSGDTLYMIAKMHKVTLEALMDANPKIDPYNMQVGTELCIP